jgi:hypothetical protein
MINGVLLTRGRCGRTNYLRVGIKRVVLAGVIQSAASVDAHRSALRGTELTVVCLHAPLDPRRPPPPP